MEDEVRALVEMFPGLPEQDAFAVLQSCEGDLTVAVDEVLTMASLGTFNEEGHPSAGSPPQLWRDGSLSYSASVSYDNGEATLPARPTRDGGSEETHRTVIVPTAPPLLCDSDTGWASENGRQKLPLDSDKRRYVMGSGELDLLAEVQVPRRGAAIVLPSDFLRVPGAMTATVAAVAPAPDVEKIGDRKETSGKDTTAAEPLIDLDFDGGDGGSGGDGEHKPGKLVPGVMPVTRGAREGSTKFFGRHPLEDAESADAQSDRGEDDPLRLSWEESSDNSDYEEETVAGKTTSSSERSYPLTNGALWKGTKTNAALGVVTASAVERIAAFQPGTRFRVAVDKGVTGLGITVKEIEGRFFIHRLQTLPDGSPGAAEEAGIKVGDELLGVEELDFERERWRMDQLVSYMRDLMGVVILYVMRGPARLPLASKIDGKSGMNQEMMKGLDNGGGEGGAAGYLERDGNREGSGGCGVVDKRTRRLIEVLQEEKLLRPAEDEDVSRLFCQISERAREWDSGELWLWVADTDRRRPSREVIAALADQWKPGEPPGWEMSDSSDDDGDSSDHFDLSSGTPTSTRNGRGNGHRLGGLPREEKKDPAADLNKIGTALLGRPLFSADPLSVEEQEVDGGGDGDGSQAGAGIVGAWTGRRSSADGHGGCGGCGGGRYWSPWPKLAALEKEGNHSQQGAVVPTRGLRKALNVRVLGEEELLVDKARPAGAKTSAGGLKSFAYVLWVMDVESGAEWRVRRCHAEFDELREVCMGLRPSLGRLDFPVRLDVKKTKGERQIVKETPGIVAARRPRFEAYLQRLCSLLYVGPLHPSSAHLAHVLQDFLGTSSRVETLERLQRSRPERELRQALQVRAWQVLRLPPLERAVADFVKGVLEGPVPRSGGSSSSKRGLSAEAILKKLTEIMERLQYVIAEGCFDDLREMVKVSKARSTATSLGRIAFDVDRVEDSPSAKRRSRSGSDLNPFAPDDDLAEEDDGRKRGGDGVGDPPDLDSMAEEDEALELISGSVRRQVEAEVFVPVMERLYELLRTQGPTAQLEKTVAAGLAATKGKPQIFHGIPIKSLSPSSWHSVTKLLRVMGSFTLPCDKLDTLVAVAHAIPALYRLEHQEEDVESLGADDFLPIFIFVLVNSGVERVAAQALVVETLCDPKRMMGEAGFCLATLSAALQHLARVAEGDQSRKSALYSFLGRRA